MKILNLLILILPFVLMGSIRIDYGYDVGNQTTDFSLKNVDGEYISMSANPDNKGYILVFTCNTCPWARGYEQRIIDLHNKYAPRGYPVIAIQPNDPAISRGDSFEEMKKRANKYNYPFPYVLDKGQDITFAYGATKTPDIFLVQRKGKDYILRYKGTIDDSPRDATLSTVKYVENAVDQLLAGEAIQTTKTKGMGCSIKWSAAKKEQLGKS